MAAEGFAIEFIAFVAGELKHAKRLQRLGRQVRPRAFEGNGRASSATIQFSTWPIWPGRRATVAPRRRPPQRSQAGLVRRIVFSRRSS
jgi:hypothetical protein